MFGVFFVKKFKHLKIFNVLSSPFRTRENENLRRIRYGKIRDITLFQLQNLFGLSCFAGVN